MKWQGREESENIEDRRGGSGKTIAAGGGILTIIIVIVGMLLGGDPQQLMSTFNQGGSQQQYDTPVEQSQEEKNLKSFASVTLKDNETIWTKIFAENGMQYQKPTMVIFRDQTESPCGMADARTGPFYCPADQKIYLSLYFFNELTQKLGAHGDFAFAYVISHEVGHHIQQILGTTNKVRQAQANQSEAVANKYSVALELQADFYAGVWAHYNQTLNNALEDGDIEEAMSAANAVGDDRLQKRAQGYVVPDAFTHGTSQQRMYWFKKGYETGDIRQGDTFAEMR